MSHLCFVQSIPNAVHKNMCGRFYYCCLGARQSDEHEMLKRNTMRKDEINTLE